MRRSGIAVFWVIGQCMLGSSGIWVSVYMEASLNWDPNIDPKYHT